jgi:hypothetical protein
MQHCNYAKTPKVKLIYMKSTINLAKHPIARGKSKHIELKFSFFVRTNDKGEVDIANLQY